MERTHRRIGYIIYAVCMAAVIMWLFFANSLIVKAVNRGKVQQADFQSILDEYPMNTVRFHISKLEYTGGMFEKFTFNGYAFCETEEDNSERQVSLVLHDVKTGTCYELMLDLIERYDLQRILPGQLNISPTGIPNAEIGVLGYFSTLEIEDGVYDVCILCRENDKNSGLLDTWYQIEKGDSGIQIYPWCENQTNQEITVTNEDEVPGHLSRLTISEEYIRLGGWEYVEGRNCNTQTVYVEFTDSENNKTQYMAKSAFMENIASELNDNQYAWSGWSLRLSSDDLVDDTYIMRILIKNGDEVWSTQPYIITKEAGSIALQQ